MRVHDSQAYREMDVTRERISRILELRKILMSFQTGFNLTAYCLAKGQKVFVWSDCLLDLGTDFLVGNTVFV